MVRTRKPLTVGITVFVVMAALVAGGFAYQRNVNKPVHKLSISFPTASGLLPGSDVFEAGAKIGSISSIDPTLDNRVMVTTNIADEYWPLHEGLSADIRPKSLLGEKYVDLHDGPTNHSTYNISHVLTASEGSVPVELDQFLNSLDVNTRSAARILLNDVGAGIAGRGMDLNQALQTGRANLDHLATFGTTLNNRDPDLDRIIVGLDGLLQKLTQNDQLTQMSQLISNGQQTLHAIEAERDSWSRSFTDASVALADVNGAIDTVVPNLRDLLNTAPTLLGNLNTESAILADLASHVTTGNLLALLQNGLTHGPTASGGALEVYPDGRKLPIFRVCLALPQLPGQHPDKSCQGGLFNQPGPEAVPVSADGSGGAGGMVALAEMIGA
jgi:phospholipid/cholesterol/gamma-HCH transport system substrate-binding protein